uniref:Uncharacterized protein n=1 Tax=Trichuris muris TaxID=70415 RepID=A0A5S6QB81_TRIMR
MNADDYCEKTLSSIMFAHGDAAKPLRETLLLLKSALEHQLLRYLQAALRASSRTTSGPSEAIGCLDLLTAIHMDRRLLRQTIYRFGIRDYTSIMSRTSAETRAKDSSSGWEREKSERYQLCVSAVHLLFPTGFTLRKLIESHRKLTVCRQLKVYMRCSEFNDAQYKLLSDARAVSFIDANASVRKFCLWLSHVGLKDYIMGMSKLAVELLATIAYGIIATIMDIAISLPQHGAPNVPLQPDHMKEAIRRYLSQLVPTSI